MFVDNGKVRKVSARKVDKSLKKKGGKWYKDRDYPHRFLTVDKVEEM